MAEWWDMIERAIGLLVTLTGLLTWVGGPIGYFLLRRRRAAEDRKAEAEADQQEVAAQRQVVEMVAMPAAYWERLAMVQAGRLDALQEQINRLEKDYESRLRALEADVELWRGKYYEIQTQYHELARKQKDTQGELDETREQLKLAQGQLVTAEGEIADLRAKLEAQST